MIKWRLIAVMDDYGVDNQRLAELTGLHPTAISKLRQNPPKRLDMETLDKLCKALGCQAGELIVFKNEEVKE